MSFFPAFASMVAAHALDPKTPNPRTQRLAGCAFEGLRTHENYPIPSYSSRSPPSRQRPSLESGS